MVPVDVREVAARLPDEAPIDPSDAEDHDGLDEQMEIADEEVAA